MKQPAAVQAKYFITRKMFKQEVIPCLLMRLILTATEPWVDRVSCLQVLRAGNDITDNTTLNNDNNKTNISLVVTG